MGEIVSKNGVLGKIRISCPGCGFSREFPGDAIPPRATQATCPKCTHAFPLPAYIIKKTDAGPEPAGEQSDWLVAADSQPPKKTEEKPKALRKGGSRTSRHRSDVRPSKWKVGIVILVPVLIVTAVFLLYCGIVVARSVRAGSGQHIGQTIMVQPQGVFAQVDTRRTLEVIQEMSSQDHRKVNRAIEKIIADPGIFQPPAFFALAASLYKEGKAEEAIFWLNAGRVRARFDANRCADVSARQAVRVLSMQMPADLIKEQFKDLDRFRSLVVKAIEWDRATPYDYDHRWINLHGMAAMISGMEKESGEGREPAETSLPKEQWPAIAERTREAYLQEFEEVIADLRDKSSENR
ncbi:MAG TPA: zinc-ribbon domain-containing protein [Desulfuromonadales bacterium]|nr:zinc-ribbon domain-containing protein [Desulfuromonadales bacterium]